LFQERTTIKTKKKERINKMILKLTNNLPFAESGTTFYDIECGTVFEFEEHFYIKVNNHHALAFTETPTDSPIRNFWGETTFTGEEKITIIESELILKSRKR
jgi:hypothetical protein